MKRSFFLVAAVLLGLVLLSLFVQRYWIRQYSSGAQVLWHDDECYVFVGSNTVGWSGSYLEEKWKDLKSLVIGNGDPPRKLGEDLTVFRYSHGTLEKYFLKGMPSGVGVAPFEGTLYAFIGGQAPLPVWRWTGSNFVQLDNAEATRIRGSFKLTSELIAREGWFSNDLLSFGVPETVFSTKLESGEIKIILRSRGFPNPHNSISIQSSKGESPEQLLWEQHDVWKRVDRATYSGFLN